MVTNKAVIVIRSRPEVGCRKINNKHSLITFDSFWSYYQLTPTFESALLNLCPFVNADHFGQHTCPLHVVSPHDRCPQPMPNQLNPWN